MSVELLARAWDRPVKSSNCRRGQYSASWGSIVKMLRGELRAIGAAQVIIECDVQPDDIRNDGWLRSSARLRSPGVRLFFKCKHGHLNYEAGTWSNWEHNVYAIARTLRAQRMIARDGAVQGDQIYMGFKALPGAAPEASGLVFEAWKVIASVAGVVAGQDAPSDKELVKRIYREAARKSHPDSGGCADAMSRVNQARDVLEKAGLV